MRATTTRDEPVHEGGCRVWSPRKDAGYEETHPDIPEGKAAGALGGLPGRLLQLQDEERRRVARELHDSVGQYLAAIEMGLTGALDAPAEMSTDARDLLTDCLTAVRQCSRETRSLSQLLHPPLLEHVGLAVAVRDYVKGFSRRSGLKVHLDLPHALPRMDGDIETAVFRIVQESLMNVYRHSGSSRAVVRVQRENGNLAVEIQDFGRGIPDGILEPAEDRDGRLGVGIQGMRCRV